MIYFYISTCVRQWISGRPPLREHVKSLQSPVLWVGVFEQLSQLQRVLADLLHGSEQEAIQGNVDHLLQESAGLEEEHILVDLHELRELDAGVGVVVTIL